MAVPLPPLNLSTASSAFGQARTDGQLQTGDIITGGGFKLAQTDIMVLGGLAILALAIWKKK